MSSILRSFRYAFIVTIIGLLAAFFIGGAAGIFIALVLAILEISLSFDNAVVNASVLKNMDERWQRYFLTYGIIIAVFGVRLLFPILIVSVIAGISLIDVAMMTVRDPLTYANHLTSAHAKISAFGGMFLLMVFLSFVMDEGKKTHWLEPIETWLSRVGKLESVSVALAMIILLTMTQCFVPESERFGFLFYGIIGLVLYVMIGGLSGFLEEEEEEAHVIENMAKRSGVFGFLYLEVLDASFSFDGVLGAFAITKDVFIIALGLMIGAMFVRSMTVHLVKMGTLDEYIYLEHGAHYAIGVLGIMMLLSVWMEIPEYLTGMIGILFIVWAMISSIMHKRALTKSS